MADTETPVAPPKPQHEDEQRYYVIEEEADVHELIKQINKSGGFDEE